MTNNPHILRVERVVAEFNVWLGELFPFAKMKVKVIERNIGEGFLAVPNLVVRNRLSHDPEYISGISDTIDGALDDAICRFVELARQNAPESGLTEADFIWSAAEDF
ncbi:MAG: hypothetical protein ABUL64_00835 [Singulisphaera sp.]